MRAHAYLLTMTLALAACEPALDTTRLAEPYGSFGEIVYRESCQRIAYTGQLAQREAGLRETVDVSGRLGRAVCVDGAAPPQGGPPKLAAIVKLEPVLTGAIDALLPAPLLDEVQAFLEQLGPLADDGTLGRSVSSLGDVLGELATKPALSEALARLSRQDGYRSPQTAVGLAWPIVSYPGLSSFIDETLGLIASGGTAEAETQALLSAVAMGMAQAQPVADPGASERTLRVALDLLTATHPDLATGVARPLVLRDHRGLARVAVDDAGQPRPPFADEDRDGLADSDEAGRYLGRDGAPLEVPTPFPVPGVEDSAPRDSTGRALVAAGGEPLYQFLDLDGTLLAGLTHEVSALLQPDRDIVLGLLWGSGALLGPRAPRTQQYLDGAGAVRGQLDYHGFDSATAPLIDLAHAYAQLLADPGIDKTLEALSTLLVSHEEPTARFVGALLDASDRGRAHNEATIPVTSTLFDDLIPLVARALAIPGLAEDLIEALSDERVRDLGPIVARLLVARNTIDFDHANPWLTGEYPLTSNLDVVLPINRSAPDAEDNRSLLQRIAHMIHDANDLQFCNKDGARPLVGTIGTYARCDMFQIDDLALFYVLTMQSDPAGASNPSAREGADFCAHITASGVIDTTCPSLLENQIGIQGFGRFPTPAALNRALFLRQSEKSLFMAASTDDVLCSDGDRFIDVHDRSIFAWEVQLPDAPSGRADASFYSAMAPIVDAFARHDECLARDPNTGDCTRAQNAAKILVELFATLHTHWPSPQSSYAGHVFQSVDPAQPRYAEGDALVTYEPLLAEVLGQADLLPALFDLAPTLASTLLVGPPADTSVRAALLETARYVFQPGLAAGLAYRDGATSTVRADGVTPVPQATPYHLIADAYARKRASLSAVGGAQATAWRSATAGLVDRLLSVEATGLAPPRFANRRARAIAILVIDFLRARIAAHRRAGDLEAWARRGLTDDLTETLGGASFAAVADLVAKMETSPLARDQVHGLLRHLFDESSGEKIAATALTAMADLLQRALDDRDLVPLAQALGTALEPRTGTVYAQLTLLHRALAVDPARTLLSVLRNLYTEDELGVTPATRLGEVITELHRGTPGQGGALLAADPSAILSELSAFLVDERRGLTRVIEIFKARAPD